MSVNACEPDLPHLIVNVETTDATAGHSEMTQVVHQHLAGRGLTPAEHAVHAGCVSARNILAARDDHGITLLGPVGADTTQGQRDDGTEPHLPQDAFTVDWGARRSPTPRGRPASAGLTSASPRSGGPGTCRRFRRRSR